MDIQDLIKNDISNLLISLEDVIDRFYGLNFLNDDDLIQVLGLNFLYRSLINYVVKNSRKEDE